MYTDIQNAVVRCPYAALESLRWGYRPLTDCAQMLHARSTWYASARRMPAQTVTLICNSQSAHKILHTYHVIITNGAPVECTGIGVVGKNEKSAQRGCISPNSPLLTHVLIKFAMTCCSQYALKNQCAWAFLLCRLTEPFTILIFPGGQLRVPHGFAYFSSQNACIHSWGQ